MKFCLSSAWFDARVFSASASCAFAASSAPGRLDQPRLEVGGVDARQDLPRLDRLAFAHGDLRDVAGDLGLDRRLVDGLQGAGQRQPARRAAFISTRGRSAGGELERDRRLAPLPGRLRRRRPSCRAAGRRAPPRAPRRPADDKARRPRGAASSIMAIRAPPAACPPARRPARSDADAGPGAAARGCVRSAAARWMRPAPLSDSGRRGSLGRDDRRDKRDATGCAAGADGRPGRARRGWRPAGARPARRTPAIDSVRAHSK